MEITNEYYGNATTPTEDFLAHYGIRGMKWGVRKALNAGGARGERKLGRQYQKAEKKLAKLEKRAASGKKYAKRAALLGAGAAAAGGLAAAGTTGVGNAMTRLANPVAKASKSIGYAMAKVPGKNKVSQALHRTGSKMYYGAGSVNRAMRDAGSAVRTFGRSDSLSKGAAKGIIDATGTARNKAASMVRKNAAKLHGSGVTNNTIARIGAGAIGAGLGAGAAYNAYRAATTKRAAKKAQQFRAEMKKTFAGTKYANGNPSSGQKKRRRK